MAIYGLILTLILAAFLVYVSAKWSIRMIKYYHEMPRYWYDCDTCDLCGHFEGLSETTYPCVRGEWYKRGCNGTMVRSEGHD